jgi:hypothetical protein
MGRSLPLNTWRLSVGALLHGKAPEYLGELDKIPWSETDDLDLFEAIKEILHRVMRDPNYR